MNPLELLTPVAAVDAGPAVDAALPIGADSAIRLCATGDIPFGEGRSVNVADRKIGVFHTQAGFFAIDNDCPHEGGPLSDGILADACVTCPLHGRRIDLVSGGVIGKAESVRTYEIEVRGDAIWLLGLAEENAAPLAA